MRDVTPHDLGGRSKAAVIIGPFGSSLKTSDYRDSGVPLIFVRDIRAGDFSKPRAFVSDAKAKALGAHIALPGDLLVTKMGDPPGDVAIYDGAVPAVITADCIRLRPAPEYDRRFLLHAFRSPQVRRQVLEITSGAAQKKVSLERFRDRVAVPVPSLDCQRRIASILDLADALRVKRLQVLAHLDSLPLAMFRDLFGSSNRSSTELGELVTLYSGGTPSKSTAGNWQGDLPWFSMKDLKATDLYDSQDHIDVSLPARSSLRLLPADTVVVGVRGMILAHTVPTSVLRLPATINQDLKALLPRSALNVDFLAAGVRAAEQWLLARVATSAHGTKKLDSSVLLSAPIPLATTDEITRFAARVRRVAAERAIAQSAVGVSERLFASLQSRAFQGQL